MKKLLTLLLAVCAITLISCKKDKDNPVEPKKFTKLVKTVKEGTRTETFTYDDQQRMIRRETTPSNYKTFEYDGNTIRARSVSGVMTNVAEVEIENGVMTNAYAINRTQRTLAETYKYDAQGYLVSSTPVGGDAYLFTWTDGNMTKETSGESFRSYTYGSEPSLVNYNFTLGALINGFEGKTNANLVKSASYSRGAMTSFAYELDADGCPIKITANRDGMIAYTTEITYY